MHATKAAVSCNTQNYAQNASMAIPETNKQVLNAHEPNQAAYPGLQALNDLLAQRQTFLQPTLAHRHAAITATKTLTDPLAQSVAQIQRERRDENRRKRKRGVEELEEPVLALTKVYVEGVGVRQVWEQTRRVLDAALEEVERDLEGIDVSGGSEGGELLTEASIDDEDTEDEAQDFELDGEDLEHGDEDDLMENEEHDGEEEEDIQEDSDVVLSDEDEQADEKPRATFVQDPNKLNDGFFSIDDFNKQSQFLEQMDGRGDDDNPSDEDEIDWDADPTAQPLPSTSSKSKSNSKVRDEDEESDDGPTFGNVDLNAPESDDEQDENLDDLAEGDLDGMMPGLTNTNDILYTDFFEPPPQRPSKKKRMRALPKTQPPTAAVASELEQKTAEEEVADLERAIADVRRDLLDSEDEQDDGKDEGEEDEDLSDTDSAVLPRLPASKRNDKNLSTHEKQQLQIREEIRRLEAINVSKKPWTLSGEASAQARPLNSLIEEDLEFERTGKPVPVITAEISTDIEALIKRRILARDFDELVRRLPTSVSDTRRGRADITLDDSKPSTSLGELYEQEYQQKTSDPSSSLQTEKQSAATKKQHAEIDKLWTQVRDQLDTLSNLHFTPKRAEIEIRTVEDKPRIAMEDARPGNNGAIESESVLAPQEIYKPGSHASREQREIVVRSTGASTHNEEMTREEKLRRRRREKERNKKATGTREVKVLGSGGKQRDGKKDSREDVVRDLARGGVKVIGKGGKLERLDSKKKNAGTTGAGSSVGGTGGGGSTLKL